MARIVIDTETTLKSEVGHKASPHWPGNSIVYIGMYNIDLEVYKHIHNPTDLNLANRIAKGDTLIFQNPGFDVLYLLYLSPWFKENYCTLNIVGIDINEYLLTGQASQWPSLDDMSIKYGLPIKNSKIKDYWDNGVSTEDIPPDEILPYLEQDVMNTTEIYKAQQDLLKLESQDFRSLVSYMQKARQYTILAEFNGMAFDKEQAVKQYNIQLETLNRLTKHANSMMEKLGKFPKELEANCMSNQQVHALIYGGSIPYKKRVEVVDEKLKLPIVYKTGKKKGQTKTKIITEMHSVFPSINKRGILEQYGSVGEQHLKAMLKETASFTPEELGFIATLLEIRQLAKDTNTYYKGYSDLVFPDGMIHGQINHTATGTGRTSSSGPNLQNLSNKEFHNE